MEPSELLRKLAEVLERLQVRYLVTGSMATIAYGEPRFTNDIDVVVELELDRADAFFAAFPAPEFYSSIDAIRQAIEQRFQFNILQPHTGLKIDVIISGDTEFDRSRFARRIRMPAGNGIDVWFASPEDVIIKKLAYYHEGHSEKHLRDILGVLKVQAGKVDRVYISTWAGQMQLVDIWQDILARANQV
jgi:hypothetical protein